MMSDKLLHDIVQSIALVKKRPNKPLTGNNPAEENGLNPRSKGIKKNKDSVPKNFMLKNLLEEFEVSILITLLKPNIKNKGKRNQYISLCLLPQQ